MTRSLRVLGIVLAVIAFLIVSSSFAAVGTTVPTSGPAAVSIAAPSVAPSGTAAPAASAAPVTSPGVLPIDNARVAQVKSLEASYMAAHGGSSAGFLPPNLHAAPSKAPNAPITPLYSVAPSPMGQSYFGLSNTTGTEQATTLDTTSLRGTFATSDPLGVQTEEFDFSSQTGYGAQLNAVLTNVTILGQTAFAANANTAPGGCPGFYNDPGPMANYCPNQLWLQNVIGYNTATHSLTFENNIWNFSSTTTTFPSTPVPTVVGTGSARGGVYEAGGPAITISYPFSLALYLNTTVGTCFAGTGGASACDGITGPVSEIYFNYTVWNAAGQKVCPATEPRNEVCGEYDNVFVNGINPSINPTGIPFGSAQIQANGTAYDPVGLTNDFEMDYGIGTSSGATANVVYANATVGIYYCSAQNTTTTGPTRGQCSSWSATPAAADFGGETGETNIGANGYWETDTAAQPLNRFATPGQPVARFVTGPSILEGLWNDSLLGGLPNPGGYALSYAHISPANAWVGVAPGYGVTNQSKFQAAPTFGWFSGWSGSGGSPVPTTLGQNLYLPPGDYTVEVLLSGYAPYIGTIDLNTSNQAPTINLVRDPSTGVYTPLWAFSNSDLANISTNAGSFGLGSIGNQYRLDSAPPTVGAPFGVSGSLAWLFSDLNDYLFTVWIGEYINSTTAYAQSNPAPSFFMQYPSWQLPSLALFNVPTTDQFQLYFYHVQNFTVAGGSFYSWANSEATTLYNVVCNTCKNDLFADNTFDVSDRGMEFIDGTGVVTGAALLNTRNVVWGNTFVPDPQPAFTGLIAPSTGLTVSETFDRTYNNEFYTNGTVSASSANTDWWNVTCVSGYAPLTSPTYPGPTVCQSASFVTSYLGFSLTGSILGTSYQGGNFWFNYGNAANPYANIPYDARSSSITSTAAIGSTTGPFRGDFAPLITYSVYDPTFYETGIPSSSSTTAFAVRVVSSTGYGWLNETGTSAIPGGCTGGVCVVFYLPTGSYNYSGSSGLTGASASAANPAFGTFTISGAPVGTVTTFAFAPAFSVTFTESGLPTGTHWAINVPGQVLHSSATTTIVFSLPNGAYTYQILIVQGYSTTQSGSFAVSGAAVPISVTFTITLYAVTFTESGLPNGDTWYVNVTGYSPISTTVSGVTGTNQSIGLPNGTFSFTVATNDKTFAPSYTPSLVVAGAPVGSSVTFVEVTYGVSFSESALPSGLTWAVTFNGVPKSMLTDGGTDALSFAAEPNGTYSYSIPDVSGWHQNSVAYSGSEAVNGAALAVSVVFSSVTYGVSFTESDLPSGESWMVTFGGVPMQMTTDGGTDTLTFAAAPNGTYSYTIADVSGWHQNTIPYTGSETVSGAPLAVSVVFEQGTFEVTFSETGLPDGTTWYVNGTGIGSLSATVAGFSGTDVSVSLPNGTYNYTVASADKTWAPAYSSPVVVNGAPVSVAVAFTEVLYSVTFTETGLPSGTLWNVTLGATFLATTGSSINFPEPNGTYSYTIGIVSGWRTTDSGSVTVNGADAPVSVVFTQVTYVIVFKESGLPSGTNWNVTVGATTVSSITNQIHFHLANGTYSYSVGAVANYSRAASGHFVVNGAGLTVLAPFTLVKYTVEIKESGLASGTTWKVKIGAVTMTSITTQIHFQLANGSYTYTVDHVTNYAVTATGSFAVNGAGVVIMVHFTLQTYRVTFTESNLPNHTSWQVTIGATTISSVTHTVVFLLQNGTYSYTVSAPSSGYNATSPNGTFVVHGAAVPIAVPFQPAAGPILFATSVGARTFF